MSRPDGRRERLLTHRLGDCCETDLKARMDTLAGYRAAVPADREADLAALKPLGDDTRYTIARLLAAAGEELCVCELGPGLDVSDSAISHALSELHGAGLDEAHEIRDTVRERVRALFDEIDARLAEEPA